MTDVLRAVLDLLGFAFTALMLFVVLSTASEHLRARTELAATALLTALALAGGGWVLALTGADLFSRIVAASFAARFGLV